MSRQASVAEDDDALLCVGSTRTAAGLGPRYHAVGRWARASGQMSSTSMSSQHARVQVWQYDRYVSVRRKMVCTPLLISASSPSRLHEPGHAMPYDTPKVGSQTAIMEMMLTRRTPLDRDRHRCHRKHCRRILAFWPRKVRPGFCEFFVQRWRALLHERHAEPAIGLVRWSAKRDGTLQRRQRDY